ncbi:MAG TPA: type II secretion system protein [Pseudobacteroides sp.]|jgi:type II secretory pathway pseudopilin PulG|nr:type II secretion system protein [Pseudobacteroides sp.]
MRKLIRSRMGFTIVELIISVTLMAIITVPLMAGFANVAMMNKLTRNQIEINAVAKQVEQEVIDSLKKGGDAKTIYGADVNLKSPNVTDVKVGDGSTENKNFKYDSKFVSTSGSINEYDIILYQKKGADFVKVLSFKVYVSIS